MACKKEGRYVQNNTQRFAQRFPLWFRGHEQQSWKLLPSLLRLKLGENLAAEVSEDFLRHSFLARGELNMPTRSYDWRAVQQHFGAPTYNLDWSEGYVVALRFALKQFNDDVEESIEQEMRKACCEPVLWVLSPVVLNSCVYDRLCGEGPIEQLAVGDKLLCQGLSKQMEDKTRWFSAAFCRHQEVNGLINLSAINLERLEMGQQKFDSLVKKELYNPFFWMIAQFFIDGVQVQARWKVPPLAIIPPYHTKRIEKQRGVFTQFPAYKLEEGTDFAMERHADATKYLAKIILNDPERIAWELNMSGENQLSAMFPDH